MLSILLSLAMVGQPDEFQPDPPPDAVVADLGFEMAVEAFVKQSDSLRKPPEPYRTLIATLGSRRWKEREEASQKLLEASRQDRRWLWWGRMSHDPEIQLRSNAIIRRLSACEECGGTGIHAKWKPEWGDKDNWQNPPEFPPVDKAIHNHGAWVWNSDGVCCACEGLGRHWNYSPWD